MVEDKRPEDIRPDLTDRAPEDRSPYPERHNPYPEAGPKPEPRPYVPPSLDHMALSENTYLRAVQPDDEIPDFDVEDETGQTFFQPTLEPEPERQTEAFANTAPDNVPDTAGTIENATAVIADQDSSVVSGQDSYHIHGGWCSTDTIDIADAVEDGQSWLVTLEGGDSYSSEDALSFLDLGHDAAGTITFEDGTTIEFEGIEKIVW